MSATMTFNSPISGDCYVPEVFADDLACTLASLDFARTWESRRDRMMVNRELTNAANHAEALARTCRRLAQEAHEMATAAP